MSKTLKVGIVGCGVISDAYLTLAGGFRNVELVGCADIIAAAAEAKASRYGIKAFGVDELIASSDIDLVVNLTIPAAHFKITKAALEAGKPVYTEKPLALDGAQARELLAIAKENGVQLASATDTFLGGANQLARQIVDAGRIGTVVGGTCQFFTHGTESWHPNPDFYYKRGAGPVFDMGPYYISCLINLLGPVRCVTAMAARGESTRTIANGPRLGEVITVEVDTHYTSILEFHSGAQITFATSWEVWRNGHVNPIELYGTGGTMLLPDPNYFGGVLQVSKTDGGYQAIDAAEAPFGAVNWPPASPEIANYRMVGVSDLAEAVLNGAAPRCSGELAAHIIEVMEAIQISAGEKRFVEVVSSVPRPDALTVGEARALCHF